MITRIFGKNGIEIAFPAHQGEKGTCDFMTEKCSVECPAYITEHEIKTLLYFESHTNKEICIQLMKELAETNSTIISWFTESGDCPKRLTQKISNIIKHLAKIGIPQNGFTRNKNFWRALNSVNNTHFCLTEENVDIAKNLMEEGLVAVPDYKLQRVSINELVMCGGGGISCGSGSIEENTVEYEEDCSLCKLRGVGCYGFTHKSRKKAG